MKFRETSFGKMETELGPNGAPVRERLIFERTGRSHVHERWEHCTVIRGSGRIVIEDSQVQVSQGERCSIPPGMAHWMIPDAVPFEVELTYSDEPLIER